MVVWQRCGDEMSPVTTNAAAGRDAAAAAEPLPKATDRANNLAVFFARSGAGMLLDADANEWCRLCRSRMRGTAADVRTYELVIDDSQIGWPHGQQDHHIPYPVAYKHDEHILPAIYPESNPASMREELKRTSSGTSRSHRRASSWQLRPPHDDGIWWRTGRWQGGTVFS